MIIYHAYLIEDEIMVNSKRCFNALQCLIVFVLFRACYQFAECTSNKRFRKTVICEHDAPNSKMAKFFKSIFHTTERHKSPHYNEHEADEERSESPQAGSKRQLSISRSGRMRQANKKRHSLTLELYGDTIQIDAVERSPSREYHVNTPSHTAPAVLGPNKSRLGSTDPEDVQSKEESTIDVVPLAIQIAKSPEEEIDIAFEIIDKS